MISFALTMLVLVQYYPPYPGTVHQRQSSPGFSAPADTDAVATFTGTFKSADKKFLFVDVENGNTMRMYITGATKFFRDDKPAKVSDFHSGDPVTVDVSRDARMNLLAVRVAEAAPKDEKKAPAPE